ncbi:Modification methylase PvuII [Pseudomonas aeruginosa]|nr:site-specific DNA-methyltransferase [Pseudomonas aeruginosa]CRN65276.1 Modification methylase PvuII [Pseudomonas aeruginosa]
MSKARARRASAGQLELFEAVRSAYQKMPDVPLDNEGLYNHVAQAVGISKQELSMRTPVGTSGQLHSLKRREIRWCQQTLKHLKLIERVHGERGVWRLTEGAKRDLHAAKKGVKLLAFSTDLGVAIWGAAADTFKRLEVPITLCFTSPPYALRKSRAYGNPDEHGIVDFICENLEPIIENLAEDGSLVLNVSNDIFEEGLPSRSTYLERLVLAVCDRFDLKLMERFVWHNPSKLPGPIHWVSKTRQHLNVSYEPVLWFAKSPLKVKSDNRRVLQPHSDRHIRLMAQGGEKRAAEYGDGAYKLKPGSFGKWTEGKIPKNVLTLGHSCAVNRDYRQSATELGLPLHGAGMPLSLPEFLIQFLTEPGDLVVDPFGGRIVTGLAAEMLGRAWLCTEIMLEYIRGGAELFRQYPGFWLNPYLKDLRAA